MRQVTNNYWNGELALDEVPGPALQQGGVLIRTAYSLISAGTERMKLEQAQMSLVGMARSRPDQVRQVLQTIGREGIGPTYQKVMNRLKTPTPLGYSLAGTVLAVADDVTEFRIGDRVACGGSTASHAEFNFVPKNLCVPVPKEVSLDLAACVSIGSIAMHAVRQADAHLGEVVVVVGLGLVGQFCVQLLVAAGCKVVGLDLEAMRQQCARAGGAEWAGSSDRGTARMQVQQLNCGLGADAVIVAASGSDPGPVELAGELARDRARIVDVGKTALHLPWELFYEKELELKMSRSYGPGRYDRVYEEKGIDYPAGYVRWTERRNMALFLGLIGSGAVRPQLMISHRFQFKDAARAYQTLLEDRSAMGIILEYESDSLTQPEQLLPVAHRTPREHDKVKLGVIGAGNFCKSMLLPILRRCDASLVGVCTATGLSASDTARRFGFRYAATDCQKILTDSDINAVIVATHHGLHAQMTVSALRAGKSVFTEKPLALSEQELRQVEQAVAETDALLMVGFNRRFAPLAQRLAAWMHPQSGAWCATYRVNAGKLSAEHWYYDPERGGGRLLGEVCHFVDLLTFLFSSEPVMVQAWSAGNLENNHPEDHALFLIRFASGSIGQIVYSSEGDPAASKEKIEIIGNAGLALLENFKRLEITQYGRTKVFRTLMPDKGHAGELKAFLRAVSEGGAEPIPYKELFTTTRACFHLQESLRSGNQSYLR